MTPFAGNFSSAVAAAEEAARETVKADEAVAAGLRRGRVVREHGRADGRTGLGAGGFGDIPPTGGHPHAAGSGCNRLMSGAGHVVVHILDSTSLI